MKFLGLIFLMFLLQACQGNELNIYGMPDVPKGPPDYVAGWKAGCETGMTAYSSDYLRTRYRTNLDGYKMQSNSNYNKGWELGQRYCSYYVSTYLSNQELKKRDLRSDETWFQISSDGLFSYTGWSQFDWGYNKMIGRYN